MERDGAALLGPVIEAVAGLRARLGRIPGLVVLDGPGVDPTRLVLVLPGTGADGNAVESDLLHARMPVEMADRDTVVAMVTPTITPNKLRHEAAAWVAVDGADLDGWCIVTTPMGRHCQPQGDCEKTSPHLSPVSPPRSTASPVRH